MAVKFEKVKAGMTLWERRRVSGGAKADVGEWPVRVLRVDPARREAEVSWVGNKPAIWDERRLSRLHMNQKETK